MERPWVGPVGGSAPLREHDAAYTVCGMAVPAELLEEYKEYVDTCGGGGGRSWTHLLRPNRC